MQIERLPATLPTGNPPLVLFHGVVRRWQDFGPVLPALCFRNPVIAVNHRGHGTAPRKDRYFVADYIADAVEGVRQHEGPVVLVGHSLGALTALGVAAELPDKVAAIVLEDPPSAAFLKQIPGTAYAVQFRAYRELACSSRPLGQVANDLANIALPGGGKLGDRRDRAALRFLARCLADLDPHTLDPVLNQQWLDGFDPLVAAKRVQCPVLLLVSDPAQGGMLPATDADQLSAAFSDCSRIDLPGVGHQIHGTQPELFTRLVVGFLDSL